MAQRHTKSRFGCHTCRIRRVKCDETQPACKRCTATGRECDGPAKNKFEFAGDANNSVARTLRRGLCTEPWHFDAAYDERRAFAYFLQKVAPCLAGSQDAAFWKSLVPRICSTSDAARSAVIAISDLFEHPPDTDQRSSLESIDHSRALQWHCRSIHGFHTSLSKPNDAEHTEIALLSCVLLACIEFAQNNVSNAFKLLHSGFSIVGEMPEERNTSVSRLSPSVRDIILPMLARQAIMMATFGRMPPEEWFMHFQQMSPTSITAISTPADARSGLYTILWKAMELIHETHTAFMAGQFPWDNSIPSPLHEHRERVLRDFLRWHNYFQLFHLDHYDELNPQDRQAVSAMLMYYHVGHIWTICCLDITHIQHDEEFAQFASIIKHAEELIIATEATDPKIPSPSFSFEMRVIPPLFFTGWRCRHPLLRRECIDLLRRAPKQEALFVAERSIRTVERIIEIEESLEIKKALADGTWAGELPRQEDRCQHVVIEHEDNNGRKLPPRLFFTRGFARGPDGQARMDVRSILL